MAIKYTVTSFSEGRKGGQITVTVDEGRNRRSFTRHLNPNMMGLNIDERAIPLNERYEDELRKAESELDLLKKQLTELEEAVDIDQLTINKKEELAAAIVVARGTAMQASEAVDDAEVKLNIVRRELPLMMEFRRF